MKFIRKMLSGILFLALAGGVFYGVLRLSDRYLFPKSETPAPAPKADAQQEGKTRVNKQRLIDDLNKGDLLQYTSESSVQVLNEIDIESIAEKVLPSMVSVECTVIGLNYFGQVVEGQSAGSGIYFESKEGLLYLVTNHHVVEGSREIKVVFADGESYPATLKNSDELYDLAILTVKRSDLKQSTLDSIVPATLAESKEVHVGEMAIAVGNALGYGTSVTVGYIGATNHRYSTDTASISLIQTDAAINPGNSGGALVNIEGEVIGINSSKLASTDVEGMGFAIPATTAIPIIRELQEKEKVKAGEEGFLGVYISTVTDEQITSLEWPAGIYIKEIIEGGAASESDLQPGDIITEVNGVPVVNSEQLQSRISSYRYGTTVTLTVKRIDKGVYDETVTIEVTLKEKSLPVTDE
ncbi:MAG: trypsin-like peptidase domain-containing protein [Lachnospiraceae bacterium]|nr:trypsin-like peptidase domain-containing protein [Lachnospiraceae bacterium]